MPIFVVIVVCINDPVNPDSTRFHHSGAFALAKHMTVYFQAEKTANLSKGFFRYLDNNEQGFIWHYVERGRGAIPFMMGCYSKFLLYCKYMEVFFCKEVNRKEENHLYTKFCSIVPAVHFLTNEKKNSTLDGENRQQTKHLPVSMFISVL